MCNLMMSSVYANVVVVVEFGEVEMGLVCADGRLFDLQ